MGEVSRIADQLKRAFEGEAWHGPAVREVLAEVTAEMAAAHPVAGAHSIWELALHISAWEDAARRRLAGDAAQLSPEENFPPVTDTSEAAWQRTLTAIADRHQQLQAAIAGLTDAELERTVAGQTYSVYFLLHGVVQHDLYHAGQIALLKKAWSAGAR
jgi:uncharacterized damage-inducible protein DinB